MVMSAIALWTPWYRIARALCLTVVSLSILCLFTPSSIFLLRRLENEVPRSTRDEASAGIIVSIDERSPVALTSRGRVELSENAELLTAPVSLTTGRADQPVVIILKGRSSSAFDVGEAIQLFFKQMGREQTPLQIIIANNPNQSVADLLPPLSQVGQWTLISTAAEMGGVAADFAKRGISFSAWPVAYRTGGTRSDFAALQMPKWPQRFSDVLYEMLKR